MSPAKKHARQPDPSDASCDRFRSLLRSLCEEVVDLTDEQVEALCAHWSLYQRWNRVLNLSAVRDLQTAVERHYCESLFVGARLPQGSLRIVDVGSGAGFPGYPIAVLRRDCEVVLVESHQRKAAFLKEATRWAPNVAVFPGRAGELDAHFDWLVSRALSWEDLESEALRLADHIALLVSVADARRLVEPGELLWRAPQLLPWEDHGVMLVADVSRGTS